MSDNKKPVFFTVFKVLGFVGIIVFIVGIVLASSGFGNFDNNNFMIGGILSSTGFFFGFVFLFLGFKPEISKLSAKSAKYIQRENKEDLSDIADMSADIAENAIRKSARAVRDGLRSTKYCKYCGAEIDEDSLYCSKCGERQ